MSANDEEQGAVFTQVNDEADGDFGAAVCAKRGCKPEDSEGFRLQLCANPSCGRAIHVECYEAEYILCKGFAPLPNNAIICTKKCHAKVMLASKTRPGWKSDEANGPEDPISSMHILLDWILSPGNYSKFRGKNNNGTTKNQYAQMLANHMNSAGVKVHHEHKQVLSKIQNFKILFEELITLLLQKQ
eukprot:scaffold20183_cov123-Amphora_coffeaeformis.AAC.1